VSELTARDRELIARARELADAISVDELREVTGASEGDALVLVLAFAMAGAQHLLDELCALAEQLAGKEP
jgi:hypothetical protein